MTRINQNIQSIAVERSEASIADAAASAQAVVRQTHSLSSPVIEALRSSKHLLFSNLYSLVGTGFSRPYIQFLDHEICTQEFALQMGIAVAAGIPAGFAGRAAGQGFISIIGNNALGKVAAFLPRIFATHYFNSRLSGEIQARLNHQNYHWADVSLNDVLPMLNLGAGEVFGHATQGLAGGGVVGFVLGRMIGGSTNCLGTGFEIFAGHQINKISRHVLHRNLFEEVEQRDVRRDAMNVKEWIRNSVMDSAFSAGHGLMGWSVHILPRLESPHPQDFVEFARQSPQIWKATQRHFAMLAMGAIGGSGRVSENLPQELTRFREILAHAEKHLSDMQRLELAQDAEDAKSAVEDLERKIKALEEEMSIKPLEESHPVSELMGFVPIIGGKFRMGGEDGDASAKEGPIQEITLCDFAMTETVVTNAAFEFYREAMLENPYAVIATEATNPYCWVIGRFATREEAESYVGQGKEENIRDIIEHKNEASAFDFLNARSFETGKWDAQNNPNGLKIEEVVPKTYSRIMNFDRPNQPAAEVSWYEALGCADWLGRVLKGLPGRLPTAAESEFVRRGGIDPKTGECRNFKYGTSDGEAPNEKNADFNRAPSEGPKDVDDVPMNPLYVRINGVWEWCNGWYRNSLEGLSEMSAGFLKPEFNTRELRGVNWSKDSVRDARAANRDDEFDGYYSGIGFRAVVAVSEGSNF